MNKSLSYIPKTFADIRVLINLQLETLKKDLFDRTFFQEAQFSIQSWNNWIPDALLAVQKRITDCGGEIQLRHYRTGFSDTVISGWECKVAVWL